MSKMGKDFCPNFLQPLLEHLEEGAVTTEAGSLFQYFTTLTEKADPFLSAVVRTLEYLVGVPSKAASSGREE